MRIGMRGNRERIVGCPESILLAKIPAPRTMVTRIAPLALFRHITPARLAHRRAIPRSPSREIAR